MKHKLRILFVLCCLISFQNAEAQLFKRMKQRAKEKAKELENKVINKAEKKVEKTIDDAIEGKNDPNAGKPKVKKVKDFGDVVINHSNKYGNVQITEVHKVKVSKTNSGYTIRGSWWSHEADIYDGFTIYIRTKTDLKKDSETSQNPIKRTFNVREEATFSLGYDPQLPYNKKSEDNFKRAVTDEYQNYDLEKGQVSIEMLSDDVFRIRFSGMATMREVIRKANTDEYSETFYETSVTGSMDIKTPEFINEETVVKNEKSTQKQPTWNTKNPNNSSNTATPGTYNFTFETVTKITVPEQNRSYNMSYLLNPNAKYIAIKADMSEYSEEEMQGESIIVMDEGNTHIFVETAGMKMRMSNGMMGQQKMNNPTDQMANYDYTKLKKTGNTKTILGATCYEYEMSDNNVKVNFWVAPSVNLSNWFIQDKGIIEGYIMEYTVQSNEGTMKSETIAIKDNISKTINPKEYKKMF